LKTSVNPTPYPPSDSPHNATACFHHRRRKTPRALPPLLPLLPLDRATQLGISATRDISVTGNAHSLLSLPLAQTSASYVADISCGASYLGPIIEQKNVPYRPSSKPSVPTPVAYAIPTQAMNMTSLYDRAAYESERATVRNLRWPRRSYSFLRRISWNPCYTRPASIRSLRRSMSVASISTPPPLRLY
jgi:hypothetical protein